MHDQDLLARMDTNPSLRVVVFESANPEFYVAHFDLTGKIGNIMTAVGPSGLPILMDTFVHLTKSPVVSIAKIRGCVRGVSFSKLIVPLQAEGYECIAAQYGPNTTAEDVAPPW
jgi:hypothetical protein